MRTDLVVDALPMALSRRARAPTCNSSTTAMPAASQYTSYAFTQVLDDHGVLASIGSIDDTLENALAESVVDSSRPR